MILQKKFHSVPFQFIMNHWFGMALETYWYVNPFLTLWHVDRVDKIRHLKFFCVILDEDIIKRDIFNEDYPRVYLFIYLYITINEVNKNIFYFLLSFIFVGFLRLFIA